MHSLLLLSSATAKSQWHFSGAGEQAKVACYQPYSCPHSVYLSSASHAAASNALSKAIFYNSRFITVYHYSRNSSHRLLSELCLSFSAAMSPIVAVVGVGYVGEHLVTEFSKHYPTIAYDVDPQRLDQIAKHTTVHQLMTTRKAVDLSLATHILISVPTDVFHDGTINTTILRKAIATALEHAQHGATIVIESSVAVGMTRDLFGMSYLERGLKIGMSPEVS